jgi:hypothetical protein
MNDDFIYKALPKVPRDFAQSLYEKISAARPKQLRSAQRMPRRLQVALILLAVFLLVAWSQIRLWIRYVPVGDHLWVVEFALTQPAGDIQTMEAIPTPGQPSTVVMMIDGTQEVIILGYRFDMLSPDWTPEGFSAIEVTNPHSWGEDLIGTWSNNAQETIRLFVVPRVGGARPYAPPGMYKEVEVNGQPAILVFGRLAPAPSGDPQAPRKWDATLGLRLTWSTGDPIYTLETLGPYVTEQDLIRMAESMKPVPAPWQETIR